MMAHRVIPFGMQVHADHIKPDGTIMEFESTSDLCSERGKFALLGSIDMHFGTRAKLISMISVFSGVMARQCASLHFDDHDEATVGRFGEQVDFTKAGTKVAGKDAVAMLPKKAGGDTFAELAVGEATKKRRAQELEQARPSHVVCAD